MTEKRENISSELIFELLKKVRETQLEHSRDFVEVKERLGILEMQYASLSRRVDRIDQDISLIKTRLDLVGG